MSERMRIWIDDLCLSTIGSQKQVGIELTTSVASTAAGFQEQGLQLVSKFVAMCSYHAVATSDLKKLKQSDMEVQATLQASYLGMDQREGLRLARRTRTQKIIK
eukprot:7386016-Pyramimonas_sp.AAC.1